ncbi:polysaccharide pyruvyl transferase family protein [Magnetococcus sp. PR-3]|uniref:polysaccharide pyruvyl transferase family protein n=1 Tax=Magnetococcus sp. PR-3 TaxID=3120355 RepID=UPI002FCE3D7A
MKSVLIINDTSGTYHHGCHGTSQALVRGFQARGCMVRTMPVNYSHHAQPVVTEEAQFEEKAFAEQFHDTNILTSVLMEEADLVVVNMEGTLHRLRGSARMLLWLAWYAKRWMATPVMLVNGSLFPYGKAQQPQSADDQLAQRLYQKVLRVMDGVVVRDPISKQVAEQMGVPVQQGYDSLPLFLHTLELDDQVPAYDLCLSSGVATPVAETIDYVEHALTLGLRCAFVMGAHRQPALEDVAALKALQAHFGHRCDFVNCADEQRFFSILNKSRAILTDRFHYVVAANFLGVPLFVGESNTPKIQGISGWRVGLWLKKSHFLTLPNRDAFLQAIRQQTADASVREEILQLSRVNQDLAHHFLFHQAHER